MEETRCVWVGECVSEERGRLSLSPSVSPPTPLPKGREEEEEEEGEEGAGVCPPPEPRWAISHLVDPASSHMLSSKAKPCMSKYKGTARNCERLITTVAIHMALSLPSRITLGI